MSYITDADPYLSGDSVKWKNWQSNYKEPKTCISCENRHGQIYPYHATLYEPEHLHCRCKVVPMRTKKVGTATEADFDFSSGRRNRKRILYSSDGLIFVSYDHAQSFYELVR